MLASAKLRGAEGVGMSGVGETIGFDDFLKLDIRVGTVVKAEPYPEARQPAYKVWVDFGAELGVKETYEHGLSDLRELTELSAKANSQAADLLSHRVTDGLNELKGAFKPVNGGAETAAQ